MFIIKILGVILMIPVIIGFAFLHGAFFYSLFGKYEDDNAETGCCGLILLFVVDFLIGLCLVVI